MKEFEVLAVWLIFLLFCFFIFVFVCDFCKLVFILVFFRVFCFVLFGILCTIKKVYGFVGNFPKFTLRQMSIRKFPRPK